MTEERLREHFAQKGEVTDAKIIRTRCVPVIIMNFDTSPPFSGLNSSFLNGSYFIFLLQDPGMGIVEVDAHTRR